MALGGKPGLQKWGNRRLCLRLPQNLPSSLGTKDQHLRGGKGRTASRAGPGLVQAERQRPGMGLHGSPGLPLLLKGLP